MPRVVADQKAKFESDELFKKLSQEVDVRYTGAREKSQEERRERFVEDLKQGHSVITFATTGTNIALQFIPRGLYGERAEGGPLQENVDFDREPGKVHLMSSFILNGVCVKWVGYIDLESLNGKAALTFDSEQAKTEDLLYRENMEQVQEAKRQFEERLWQEQRGAIPPSEATVTSPGT